jgi:PAS domain S-box-containing protein
MTVTGTHDSVLVALSILIAVAASYTALDLAGRVRASTGWARGAWLTTAALAMGGGIWAMHFVAMLAFSMPGMEVAYDVGLTLLSLVIAVVATGISFLVMSRAGPSPMLLLASGLFMGLGIVAMHYMGMAAMEMAADLRHDRPWVVASILVAIGAATAALWLSVRTNRVVVKFVSAVAMGIAISGMHFAAMQGAVFAVQSHVDMTHGRASLTQVTLALAVAASTFLILFLALIAAMFDRRFAVLAEREAKALRQSEERFRSLYTRTPLPLHSLDQAGCIEHVTDAWLNLMGYQRGEVIGRPLINFMTEPSARQAVQSDWPMLLQNGELRDIEYRLVTKAGEFLDVVASARVERDDQNTFLRALGGLTNVTERKRAEEALRQSQKMEAVGQLTGGVAHDFNNLLFAVQGNLELLRKHLPDDPRAARYLDNALLGVQRGAGLTQRMLAFARKQNLKPEAVNVPELVRGMADLLQRSLGPMVRIDTHFPLPLSCAHVDANQLELVLLNLAVNARDAMPDGGTLSISASEHTLAADRPGGLQPGRYVCLSVTDTGAGMDPTTLARAMEPFFTTKGIGKGTGLGLSMAHGMAAQSGGRLILRSELGQGTTVELWLPAVREAQQAARPDPAGSVPLARHSAPLTILVVDDDALVLANTAAMLDDLGHAVIQASSGQDALALLRAGHPFDLVVTDQAMPGMTGVQLAAIIQSERPHLPVLLVTGYAELPSGIDASPPRLSKPFSQSELAQAVSGMAGQTNGASVIPLRARHEDRRL